MAAILPVLQVVGAVVSAIGALRQASAASKAANAQAEAVQTAATFNATVSAQNAEIAQAEAADNARRADRETYMRLGAIRAAQGASGGAAGEGSVLDIIGDVAAQGELEKQNILYQGELKARGYQNTAALDRYSGATQAQALRTSGENARTTGYWKAGSELLGGAVGAYTSYTKLKRAA